MRGKRGVCCFSFAPTERPPQEHSFLSLPNVFSKINVRFGMMGDNKIALILKASPAVNKTLPASNLFSLTTFHGAFCSMYLLTYLINCIICSIASFILISSIKVFTMLCSCSLLCFIDNS